VCNTEYRIQEKKVGTWERGTVGQWGSEHRESEGEGEGEGGGEVQGAVVELRSQIQGNSRQFKAIEGIKGIQGIRGMA
jgi:hypothetical protein